jgi:hypothetical protein
MMNETENRICVERRSSNSPRLHFNRVGDWRPRLIVWPEYNGYYKDEFHQVLDPGTDAAWGKIIVGALTTLAESLDLCILTFESESPSFWKRLVLPDSTPSWKRSDRISIDVEYVNSRQDFYHEFPVFLMVSAQKAASVPMQIRDPVLDRSNLLPLGTAIFDLGCEEAVLEIAFTEAEHQFLQILERVAPKFGHEVMHTESHFISHWIIANKNKHGPEWDKF